MSFCFIHAADLHLDTPATGMGRLPEALFEQVRDASLDAFDALVQLTIDKEAAFLLISGDLYEGLYRGVRAQHRFLEGIKRLDEHSVQVFMVRGDGDTENKSVEDWPAVQEWPDNFTLFDSKSVKPMPVERDGERLATLYGISFAHKGEKRNLALHFKKEDEPAGLQVAMLHCDVNDSKTPGPCSSCTKQQLELPGMDYWALGHHHKYQSWFEEETQAVYAGTHQGRGFYGQEVGAKGAVVVQVTAGKIEEITFEPLDRVRFVKLHVDLSECSDYASGLSEVNRCARELYAQGRARPLVIKALLSGCEQILEGCPLDDFSSALKKDLSALFNVDSFPVGFEEPDLEGVKAESLVIGHKDDLITAVFAQSESVAEDWKKIKSLASIEKQALTAAMKAVLGDAFPEDTDMENAHALLAEAEKRALLGLRTGD